MKHALLFALALTAGLAVVAAVPACPPIAYNHNVVVKEVVKEVAVVAPVAVFVPTFTVGYTPYVAPVAPVAPAAAAPAPGTAEVLAELRKLSGRLDAIEKGRPAAAPAPVQAPAPKPGEPIAPPAAQPVSALSVYQAKCAVCHQQGREDQGGGFVLLDQAGQKVTLDDRAKAKMMSLTYSGKMPPKSNKAGVLPLTDEEVALVMQDLR